MCCLGLQEPLSLILLANLSYLILSPVVAFSGPVSLSLCVMLCLCLSPSTSIQASCIPKAIWEQKSPGLSPVLSILELLFPSQAKLGISISVVKVLPPLSSKFLSLFPPLIWERMFLEEGNLDTLCGLNKRENADNSERLREVVDFWQNFLVT